MSGAVKQVGSSVMGGLFPTQGASSYGGPTNWYTPFSSTAGGVTTLDPSIRSLQDQYLTGMKDIGTQYDVANTGYTASIQDILKRFLGNEGAYMQAAVDPVKAAGAASLGAAQQGFGLRGLGGSSFATDALTGMGLDIGRAVGDVGARATSDILGMESGLQGNLLSAAGTRAGIQGSTVGALDQVSQKRLSQELASLGLSQGQIAQFIDTFQNQQARQLGLSGAQQRGLQTLNELIRGGSSGGSPGVSPSMGSPNLGAGTLYGS